MATITKNYNKEQETVKSNQISYEKVSNRNFTNEKYNDLN